MKNIKYIFVIALFSILLACNPQGDCLSPNNDCNCPEGYEGNNCDTKVTAKFLGSYIPEASNNSMTVFDTLSEVKRVNLKKFNYFNDFIGDFYGIVDGEHITVPKQQPTNTNPSFKQVEGDVCLSKTGTQVSLIMKLNLNNSPQYYYRIVYLRK